MQIVYYIYLGILTMAGLTAIVTIRRGLSSPTKIIAVLVFYTTFVEWSAFYKIDFLQDKNNVQMYNFFMLVQYLAFAYYFQQMIKSISVHKVIYVFQYFFPIFWYILVFFVFKIDEWNSYSYIVGGVFTIFWAIAYCYELFTANEPLILSRNSEFWIAIGLLFFYVCSVPYMGMYRFLTEYHPYLATLLWIPLQVLNIFMYSLFTYAFICQLTATKRS